MGVGDQGRGRRSGGGSVVVMSTLTQTANRGRRGLGLLCCAKCSHVKAMQKTRAGSAEWNESVGTVRCSNGTCLAL
eukprot:1902506-Pyramimonas_sp.AAC.1